MLKQSDPSFLSTVPAWAIATLVLLGSAILIWYFLEHILFSHGKEQAPEDLSQNETENFKVFDLRSLSQEGSVPDASEVQDHVKVPTENSASNSK